MTMPENIKKFLMKHLEIDPDEENFVTELSKELYAFVRKDVIKECVGEVYTKADELMKFEERQGFTSLTATFGLHYWQCEKIADHLMMNSGAFSDKEVHDYIENRLDRGVEIYKERRKTIVQNINKKG